MITDTELLGYIRKTTLMGKYGIDAVLPHSICQPMTDALRQQRAEYGEICGAATDLLTQRGRQPEPLPLGAKVSVSMGRAMRRLSPPSTSKIAEMMIAGNTQGAIKSIQHHRQYMGRDPEVVALSKKLLETENRNIEQMKPFL